MLIASARANFSDPDVLGDSRHGFREIDLASDDVVHTFADADELGQAIAGQTVLLLVHGYNNEQDDVYDAYTVIEDRVARHVAGAYDRVVGYTWPGGDMGLDWWASKNRANAVSRRFRFLLEALAGHAAAIDVMSHSLGARVVFKALKRAERAALVRHCFCMAPAVDNEVFERDEEFHDALGKAEGIYVFHSNRDGVLGWLYRVAELDCALGLSGPEDRAWIQRRARNVFVVNCKKRIADHGDYKASAPVYGYIAGALERRPGRFRTL